MKLTIRKVSLLWGLWLASDQPRNGPEQVIVKGRQQAPGPQHGTLACVSSSPQTRPPPGERARLASRSLGAKGQVMLKPATCWQRTWDGLQEAAIRLPPLAPRKPLSPRSLICEQGRSSDGFSRHLLNPNEQNIPSVTWALCVHVCKHVCTCL